jgi:hypothetical protein
MPLVSTLGVKVVGGANPPPPPPPPPVVLINNICDMGMVIP